MGYFALSKSATTVALDVSEVLLLFFGLVLTIGALGEYKKFPRLLRSSHSTFELLVVIGIAGELFADGGVFVFSRHLQTISDGEYAVLNKEAGDARKDAGAAIERASKNEKEAAGLRKSAEDESLARIKLQERLFWQGPRNLAIENAKAALVERLSVFRGQQFTSAVCRDDLFRSGQPPQEILFAENAISVTLKRLGWVTLNTDPMSPNLLNNINCNGIIVAVRSDAPERTLIAARELQAILNEVLLDDRQKGVPAMPPDDVRWIGHMPPPVDVISIVVGQHLVNPYPRRLMSR
jgi:hypothetical protein